MLVVLTRLRGCWKSMEGRMRGSCLNRLEPCNRCPFPALHQGLLLFELRKAPLCLLEPKRRSSLARFLNLKIEPTVSSNSTPMRFLFSLESKDSTVGGSRLIAEHFSLQHNEDSRRFDGSANDCLCSCWMYLWRSGWNG